MLARERAATQYTASALPWRDRLLLGERWLNRVPSVSMPRTAAGESRSATAAAHELRLLD